MCALKQRLYSLTLCIWVEHHAECIHVDWGSHYDQEEVPWTVYHKCADIFHWSVARLSSDLTVRHELVWWCSKEELSLIMRLGINTLMTWVRWKLKLKICGLKGLRSTVLDLDLIYAMTMAVLKTRTNGRFRNRPACWAWPLLLPPSILGMVSQSGKTLFCCVENVLTWYYYPSSTSPAWSLVFQSSVCQSAPPS